MGGYRLARSAAARVGVQFVVKSYYSPIPDLRALPDDVWSRRSPMRGVALDVPAAFARTEAMLSRFAGELAPGDPVALPNDSYFWGDAHVLHAMVRELRPSRVHELGSGQSTLVLAGACRRNAAEGHATHYEVVDPFPTVAPPSTPGVTTFRRDPAERLPLEWFAQLGPGDVLFVDTTHTVKLGSDVNRIVLDVLPALRPGVVVHFHDVFLPWEYPREWAEDYGLYWNEQYLLHAFLSGNAEWEVLCPLHALAREDPARLRAALPGAPEGIGPGAFWIRRRLPGERAHDDGGVRAEGHVAEADERPVEHGRRDAPLEQGQDRRVGS